MYVKPATDTFRDWHQGFVRRSRWLVVAVGLWAAVIAGRLLDMMVLRPQVHLERFEQQAWRVGTVPALRGRIVDLNGRTLVWSERLFQLVYQPADVAGQRISDLSYVASLLATPMVPPEAVGTTGSGVDDDYEMGDFDPVSAPREAVSARSTMTVRVADGRGLTPGRPAVIIANLDPADMQRLEPLTKGDARAGRFQIVSTYRRNSAIHDPSLGRQVGQTRVYGQVEVGVSGWEREFDSQLRGQDGRFRVMVDPHGNWIEETWEPLSVPVPGYDVYAPVLLTDRTQASTAGMYTR